MSKPSRLARPFFANTAAKPPPSRREDLNSKQKKVGLGEKIPRTGNEGNLVKQQQVHTAATPAQRKASAQQGNATPAGRVGQPVLETPFLITLASNSQE